MKYLKKYNESNSAEQDEMISDIKDRLLFLEDDGFSIKVSVFAHHKNGDVYMVGITSKDNFTLDSIKIYIDQLIGFMEDNGYKSIFHSVESSENASFKSSVGIRFIKVVSLC